MCEKCNDTGRVRQRITSDEVSVTYKQGVCECSKSHHKFSPSEVIFDKLKTRYHVSGWPLFIFQCFTVGAYGR